MAKCEGRVVRREYQLLPSLTLPHLHMQVEDFRSAGVKLLLGGVFS